MFISAQYYRRMKVLWNYGGA